MKVFVAMSVAGLLALPAVSCAQDRVAARSNTAVREQKVAQQDESGQNDSAAETRRLESVTWNPVNHQLTWVISKGQKVGSDFRPTSKDNYLIKLDDATMTYNGETRRFSKQEASNVHVLMDLISKYAADSTIWWDEGQGDKLDGNGNPTAPQDKKKEIRSNGVMHIALRQPPAGDGSLGAVQLQIRRLERQLVELKQIERMLMITSPVQPARF